MTPPFSLKEPKYDMNTVMGRSLYFVEAINPLLLLETKTSLEKHRELLKQWEKKEIKDVPDAKLWWSRNALEQCIHPTSGEVIFPLFRMCSFLPLNFLLVPYMMLPSTVTSVSRTIFIQWLNQSINAAINYANRSSDKQPALEIFKAYTAAVTVACGGTLTATMMLRRVSHASLRGMIIRGTIPFLAVSVAGIVNLAVMRRNEWMRSGSGLEVKDEDGVPRGMSTQAGRDSLLKCSISRPVWNAPCMMLPTLLSMPIMRYYGSARRHPIMTETLLQILGLSLGVPFALGLFNPIQTIPATKLEPRFQNLPRKSGAPVVNYTYYKGL
ncbi:unnamed protein product [Phytomonas sp. EM1]|nr:unnamed protein product [Phytomonas sp. EM1]|eukprot:CCW64182.1 unnamed protein product [Phytomonas sp. isolate EM1]